MDCLWSLLGYEGIELLEGINVVWKQGDWVYKYPTKESAGVFAHEINMIRSVPPGFSSATRMVEATVMGVPSSMALPPNADGRNHSLIRMPALEGHEAYSLVGHDNFPSHAIAAAAVLHCRRLQELGYANTDLKLENTMVLSDGAAITFLDWGGICRLSDCPPTRTYVLYDNAGVVVPLDALATMKLHLVLMIGEMGGLYVGQALPGASGIRVCQSEHESALVFCGKWLEPDTLALFQSFLTP